MKYFVLSFLTWIFILNICAYVCAPPIWSLASTEEYANVCSNRKWIRIRCGNEEAAHLARVMFPILENTRCYTCWTLLCFFSLSTSVSVAISLPISLYLPLSTLSLLLSLSLSVSYCLSLSISLSFCVTLNYIVAFFMHLSTNQRTVCVAQTCLDPFRSLPVA